MNLELFTMPSSISTPARHIPFCNWGHIVFAVYLLRCDRIAKSKSQHRCTVFDRAIKYSLAHSVVVVDLFYFVCCCYSLNLIPTHVGRWTNTKIAQNFNRRNIIYVNRSLKQPNKHITVDSGPVCHTFSIYWAWFNRRMNWMKWMKRLCSFRAKIYG